MAGSACETIRVGGGPGRQGAEIELVSHGQSLEATCAAMAATYYWALRRKAAGAGGRDAARGYLVEVWHVER